MFNEDFMTLEILLKCGFDFDFIYPLRINGDINISKISCQNFIFFSFLPSLYKFI